MGVAPTVSIGDGFISVVSHDAIAMETFQRGGSANPLTVGLA